MAKENDKKTMDVAKPGKPAPDISSRPVLVNHRPMVQDPMMTVAHRPDELETSDTNKDTATHNSKIIQPIDASLKPSQTNAETSDDEPGNEAESNEAAVVDAVASQADSKAKSKDNQPSPEDQAKQQQIQKLIADKTYFVPVGQVARRRNNRRAMVALLLVIILGLAGGYLLIDAGLIKTNIKLPVHLINN